MTPLSVRAGRLAKILSSRGYNPWRYKEKYLLASFYDFFRL